MMDTASDFEMVRKALSDQIDREVLDLKHWLESKTDDEIVNDPKMMSEVAERIFYVNAGLMKLSGVLGFFYCWEENGDIPQLSQRAEFREKETE